MDIARQGLSIDFWGAASDLSDADQRRLMATSGASQRFAAEDGPSPPSQRLLRICWAPLDALAWSLVREVDAQSAIDSWLASVPPSEDETTTLLVDPRALIEPSVAELEILTAFLGQSPTSEGLALAPPPPDAQLSALALAATLPEIGDIIGRHTSRILGANRFASSPSRVLTAVNGTRALMGHFQRQTDLSDVRARIEAAGSALLRRHLALAENDAQNRESVLVRTLLMAESELRAAQAFIPAQRGDES